MNDNKKYTNLWTDNFDLSNALEYDKKFYNQFEKNIKHRQQIEIIQKYLENGYDWLDSPVGSGRMMNDIMHDRNNCYIFDYSQSFLSFSKDRLGLENSNVFQGDIFNIDLERKFDLITCNNMLFAFENFDVIISKLINNLKKNGILICDVVNKDMYERYNSNVAEKRMNSKGWNKSDILKFCNLNNCEIVDIIPHDYYDNEYVLNWKREGNIFTKKMKSVFWKVLNKVYFKFYLFNLFNMLEDKDKTFLFNKYIIILKKKSDY